jgi:hypothetical protein
MTQLTQNEVLVLLAAGTKAMVDMGAPEDADDRESLAEVTSAVQKLRRMVGMDDATFARLSSAAAEEPQAFPGKRERAPAIAAADPAAVRAMMEWLVARFEEHVSEHGTAYMDAFMGCHNFHKAIVLDLAARDGAPREAQRLLLVMARDTWDDAINKELRKLAD